MLISLSVFLNLASIGVHLNNITQKFPESRFIVLLTSYLIFIIDNCEKNAADVMPFAVIWVTYSGSSLKSEAAPKTLPVLIVFNNTFFEEVLAMFRKQSFVLVALLLMALLLSSCSGGVSSTSVDGASLELGTNHNDDLEIVSPQTTFAANENFYLSFDNNASFGVSSFDLIIENLDSGVVTDEISFNVDPEWSIVVTDTFFIEVPGKYKFSAVVNGRVRATQEIIVE
ncbi:MAG: hypothetical protein EOM23_05805 [Candidatus Moranbacteria bacterium]|nr:hypothetical protein [Candidatus Moranbacteria bacterium]